MKIQGRTDSVICADGKFFTRLVSIPGESEVYRQIELYLPSAEGTYGELTVATMERWLKKLENGDMTCKWAVGSTGGQLTARYQIRPSDGELISQLSLSGGMK